MLRGTAPTSPPITANPAVDPSKNSKLFHLRRFFYDVATAANPIQIQALKSLIGIPQMVFGSDFPFAPIGIGVRGLESSRLTADELGAIYSSNASRILAVS